MGQWYFSLYNQIKAILRWTVAWKREQMVQWTIHACSPHVSNKHAAKHPLNWLAVISWKSREKKMPSKCFLFANIGQQRGVGRGTDSVVGRWHRRNNDIVNLKTMFNYTTHLTSRWKPRDFLLKMLLIHIAKTWSDCIFHLISLRAVTKSRGD